MPISQPNWVGSERSKYLLNQENLPDLSEHTIWPEHASLHACMLCACMHRPISQPNWVKSERSKYLWNQENMLDLSELIIYSEIWLQAWKHIACKLACLGQIMCSERSGMFSWFHRYLHLSDPTQFGWDMGPSMQAYSMHAGKLVFFGWSMCSEKSGLFSWFHRYFDLSDLTQFGVSMAENSVHSC